MVGRQRIDRAPTSSGRIEDWLAEMGSWEAREDGGRARLAVGSAQESRLVFEKPDLNPKNQIHNQDLWQGRGRQRGWTERRWDGR